MRYNRECKECGLTEGLRYAYTRRPTPWDGALYCKEHYPNDYPDKHGPKQKSLLRDSKPEAKRKKRRKRTKSTNAVATPRRKRVKSDDTVPMELGG